MSAPSPRCGRAWAALSMPRAFAAGLLQTRRLAEPGAPEVPLEIVEQGARLTLGPFEIEFVPMSHSIPEARLLAIRTPAGTVVHSGDWKLDRESGPRPPDRHRAAETDRRRGRAGADQRFHQYPARRREPFGGAGRRGLARKDFGGQGRVLVTTFASNVARLRAVCLAAQAAGRQVVLAGRAMERVAECGARMRLSRRRAGPAVAGSFSRLPAEKVLVLATGSQGEARAAMSRIIRGEHAVKLCGQRSRHLLLAHHSRQRARGQRHRQWADPARGGGGHRP